MKRSFDLHELTPEAIRKRRAELTAWLTMMVAIALAFVTAVRPLFSTLHPVFFGAGVINTSLLLTLWVLLRKGYLQKQAPAFLLGLCTLMALPLILISGGPNSHYSPVIPLFPFIGLLLGSLSLAVTALLFWSVVWVAMAWMLIHGLLPQDLTMDPPNLSKTVSRTLWLIVSSVIALIFAIQFDHRSRQLREYLLELVESDPLTSVGNRRRMNMALEQELTNPHQRRAWLCLMLIDVDHFKRYNDLRGHAAGDVALKRVAGCLQQQLERENLSRATLARYGGEEFVLVLPDTDPAAAWQLGNQLRQAVIDCSMTYQDQCSVPVTITVGYACSSDRAHTNADQLFDNADQALYHGKHKGRNCVVDYDHLKRQLQGTAAPAMG